MIDKMRKKKNNPAVWNVTTMNRKYKFLSFMLG